MLRAYASFGESVWESCSKQAELKAIVFALCFFHSVVCERRKFGPIGWNNGYPFNQGDLSVCIAVANNYLDNSSKVRRRSLAMRRSPARRAPRHHCAPAPLRPAPLRPGTTAPRHHCALAPAAAAAPAPQTFTVAPHRCLGTTCATSLER